MTKQEEKQRLRQTMRTLERQLPEKYKTVLYLYYYEEYSCKEIAEMMQKKESTVRSLLKRGREALQKKIGGDGYAAGLESHLGQSQSG